MTRNRQDILASPEYRAFETSSIGTAGSGALLGALSTIETNSTLVLAAGFIGFGYAHTKLGFFEPSYSHYNAVCGARFMGIALTLGIYGLIQSVFDVNPEVGMLMAGLIVVAAARLLTHLPEPCEIPNQNLARRT